jgi:hypothetical protein
MSASMLAWAVLGGCAPADPHAELTALVEATEAAAEARDTGYFRSLIAADYVGRGGQRKDDVIDRIRAYFLINQKVEIVLRVEAIEVIGDDAAMLRLQAGVLGRGNAGILDVDADLLDLDVELVRDGGDWRVIGADWERSLK